MKRKKQRLSGMPAGIAIGSASALVMTLAGTMVLTAMITGEKIQQEQMAYGAAGVILLSSFLNAWITAGIAGGKRLLCALISASVYMLTLLCMSALFFEGIYADIGVTSLLIFGAAIAAALLGHKRKDAHYRSKKYRLKKV